MLDPEVLIAVFTVGAVGAGLGRAGRRLLETICGVRLPRPWCEVGIAMLWATVAARVESGALPVWWSMLPLVLSWLAVVLVACDLLASRLPDVLTLPAYPVFVILLVVAGLWGRRPWLLLGALAGAVLFAGVYAVVRRISAASMGPGDVKLAGSLGAVVGAVSVPAVVLCMVAAAVLTLVPAWRARGGPVAHGPAMLAPAWLVTAFPAVSTPPGAGW